MKGIFRWWSMILLFAAPAYPAFDFPAHTARAAALANSYYASTFSAEAFLLNPALVSNATALYASLNYYQLYNLKELRYANGLVAFPLWSANAGIAVEDFGSSLYRENRLTVDVAKSLYNNKLAIGIAAQFYSVSAQGFDAANTFGVSAGFRYEVIETISVGGSIENLNQPKLNGHTEEIPQRTSLGLEFKPVEQFSAYLAVQKDSWYDPAGFLGIEYKVFRSVDFFSGYTTTGSIPSAGIELHQSHLRINYSLQYSSDLGATHFVGIAFDAN